MEAPEGPEGVECMVVKCLRAVNRCEGTIVVVLRPCINWSIPQQSSDFLSKFREDKVFGDNMQSNLVSVRISEPERTTRKVDYMVWMLCLLVLLDSLQIYNVKKDSEMTALGASADYLQLLVCGPKGSRGMVSNIEQNTDALRVMLCW